MNEIIEASEERNIPLTACYMVECESLSIIHAVGFPTVTSFANWN